MLVFLPEWQNLNSFVIIMADIYIFYYKSPLGSLIIGDYNGGLCMLDWQYRARREQVDARITSFFNASFVEKQTGLHTEVIRQVTSYIGRETKSFDLPLVFAGTEFQQKVWNALLEIPFGKTVSYLELSRQLGDEKAIRAVAAANGANAISIIVPCHRVVGSNGELTGYAGGTRVKQQLLQLEGATQQAELFG